LYVTVESEDNHIIWIFHQWFSILTKQCIRSAQVTYDLHPKRKNTSFTNNRFEKVYICMNQRKKYIECQCYDPGKH
jgi:hypothetical protein